ncbi:hypothetical protein DIPPA_06067 [Diplonema papillatum]|nr:hypothetical protein DIPPA_06067 [Diplonema papillatum]
MTASRASCSYIRWRADARWRGDAWSSSNDDERDHRGLAAELLTSVPSLLESLPLAALPAQLARLTRLSCALAPVAVRCVRSPSDSQFCSSGSGGYTSTFRHVLPICRRFPFPTHTARPVLCLPPPAQACLALSSV